MTLLIGDKQIVSMHYTLTNDEGEILDSSDGQSPLSYLHGASNIIPGLEKELTGKTVGAKLKVTVHAEDGYGEFNPELLQQAPLSAFAGVEDLQVGMELMAHGDQGQQQMITVREINDDNVIIDTNHPLAGQTLHFDVEITDIRAATEQELSHGHVHPTGQDH